MTAEEMFKALSEEERKKVDKARQRIMNAQHAMQAGVAMDHSLKDEEEDYDHNKHLRVGVNTAMVETSTLTRLLIEKGVFTWVEFVEKLASGHEEEKERYEKYLEEKIGTKVTLV